MAATSASDKWPGPLRDQLEGGGVATLLLSLADWDPDTAGTTRLDAGERERAARFRLESDRKAFLAGRWLVRTALREFTGRGDTVLRIDPRGKPQCPQPGAPRFNLSHCRDWVGLSLCGDTDVGLDIEHPGREVAWEALARRYFAADERLDVETGGKSAFFRIWTRKEARVKAEGTGLAVRLADIDTFREERTGAWRFHGLQPASDCVGTVAYPGPPRSHVLLVAVPGRQDWSAEPRY